MKPYAKYMVIACGIFVVCTCAGLVANWNRLEYVTVEPRHEYIEGAYGYDMQTREEVRKAGYVIVGNGVVRLNKDGTSQALGGPLGICIFGSEDAIVEKDGMIVNIIPKDASTGTWHIDAAVGTGEFYVGLHFESDLAPQHFAMFGVKENPGESNYFLCPDVDPDYCVAPMRRISTSKDGTHE